MALGAKCVLFTAGTSWTLTPPSSWCRVVNTTYGGPNGTYSGKEYQCDSLASWGWFNETRPSVLSGSMNSSGPVQVWLIPDGFQCELGIQLTGFVHPCPPPLNAGSYYWTSPILPGGVVDLSSLAVNLTATTGVLPPQVWWIEIVDCGPASEAVTVVSPVAVTAR